MTAAALRSLAAASRMLAPRDVRAFAVGGAVLALMLTVRVALPALARWTADRVASASEQAAELAAARAFATRADEARLRVEQLREAVARTEAALLHAATPASAATMLAASITAAAEEAGIEVTSLQGREPVDAGAGHVVVSSRVDATGDAEGIALLLAAIETAPSRFVVRELAIIQPDAAIGATVIERLRLELVVAALVRVDSLPARR